MESVYLRRLIQTQVELQVGLTRKFAKSCCKFPAFCCFCHFCSIFACEFESGRLLVIFDASGSGSVFLGDFVDVILTFTRLTSLRFIVYQTNFFQIFFRVFFQLEARIRDNLLFLHISVFVFAEKSHFDGFFRRHGNALHTPITTEVFDNFRRNRTITWLFQLKVSLPTILMFSEL